MSIRHNLSITWAQGGEHLGGGSPARETCEGEDNRDFAIAGSSTTTTGVAVAVGQVKSFWFSADVACTLRGVDDSSTVSLTVAADQPFLWYAEQGTAGNGLAFPFAALTDGDCTFTVINSSTVSGNGSLRVGGDFVT